MNELYISLLKSTGFDEEKLFTIFKEKHHERYLLEDYQVIDNLRFGFSKENIFKICSAAHKAWDVMEPLNPENPISTIRQHTEMYLESAETFFHRGKCTWWNMKNNIQKLFCIGKRELMGVIMEWYHEGEWDEVVGYFEMMHRVWNDRDDSCSDRDDYRRAMKLESLILAGIGDDEVTFSRQRLIASSPDFYHSNADKLLGVTKKELVEIYYARYITLNKYKQLVEFYEKLYKTWGGTEEFKESPYGVYTDIKVLIKMLKRHIFTMEGGTLNDYIYLVNSGGSRELYHKFGLSEEDAKKALDEFATVNTSNVTSQQ